MNNRERIEARIKRDKERRRLKRLEKNKQYDDFDKVFKFQNYIPALQKCNKGVSWKGSVQKYNQRAIENIYKTLVTIKNGKLPKLKNTRVIILYERGKKRKVVPIVITDRMTQRVGSDNSFIPVISITLIYDNGASMKGKGIEHARQRMDLHLKEAVKKWGSDFYIWSYDIEQFFQSIPHSTCQEIFDNLYNDKRLFKILMDIIKSYFPDDVVVGICLGSQVSQGVAVVVLNKADHYAKDKMGFRHYMRYMDDGMAFAKTKQELIELYNGMKKICDELGLRFNLKKTSIIKASKGFTWLKTKYNITKSGAILKRLTRKGIVRERRKLKKFKKMVDKGEMTLKQVADSLQSWLSHAKGKKSQKTVKSMLKLFKRLFGIKLPRKGGIKRVFQDRKELSYRWDCNLG